MTATHAVLFIWAYFLGLLVSAFELTLLGLPIGAIALLGVGCLAAIVIPRYWRTGLTSREWLIFGLIGCMAVFYCDVRSPQPGTNDISTLLNQPSVPVLVEGQIESAPRQTRSQNKQLWLHVVQATRVSESANQDHRNSNTDLIQSPKSGKLYVTLSPSQAKGLEPGQGIRLTGMLYEPKAATNPGSFDFKQYLAREGCFAGLRVKDVFALGQEWNPNLWLKVRGETSKRLWQVRQRIVRTFEESLNESEDDENQAESPGNSSHSPQSVNSLNYKGTLVSGMILGRKAVDLPPEISDEFAQAGMAHTLAASGFHVSLLLGMVLWFTRSLVPSQQAWIGISVLAGYIGLTGIQPSVMRAGLMGSGALLGKVYEQKLRPVGVLLLVAFVLVLINPIWIFHLGFQLSFLATLGLLVTAPPLTKALDWLPNSVATAIAIPISAYLWTLPIQLSAFGTVSTYSIFVNLLTTLLVILISLWGMISAAIALISPALGHWVVWPLQYPTGWLITAVEQANDLPGSTYAVGTISILQLILLYGLFGWVWWQSKWRVLPWLAGGMAIALIFIPARLSAATQSPITFLNTAHESVVVVRHHGKTGLIHSGSEADIQFTVLPFLKQQGVNRIDWAIANSLDTSSQARWQQIADNIPITDLWLGKLTSAHMSLSGVKQIKPMSQQQTNAIGAMDVALLSTTPDIVSFALGDRTWLMVQSRGIEDNQKLSILNLPQAKVLQWSGDTIPADVIANVQPTTIVSPHPITTGDPAISVYSLKDDGAIQWRSGQQPYPKANPSNLD